MKAQSNWEEKSQYLLREIVKYDLYIDSLQIAMALRLKKRGEKGTLFTLSICIIVERMFKLWSVLSMVPVQPTKRTRNKMGYQRKNQNQLSDIHVERGGSETNDLIFFVYHSNTRNALIKYMSRREPGSSFRKVPFLA